jgi:branched-chain amino acid transport system substrate-binding protein
VFRQRYILAVLSFVFPFVAHSDEGAGAFKVGIIAPLSGGLGTYGAAVRNGIELAEKDNPKAFEHVKFIFEDNRFDPTTSITAFQKLKNQDKVNLQYVWGDNATGAIGPIAEREHAPVVGLLTDPRPVKGYKWVVRFINEYEKYTDILLRYFRINKIKSMGIVVAQDPYFMNLVDGLKDKIVPGESLTVVGTFAPDETDFRSAIIKLHSLSPHIMGIYLEPGQVSAFFRQVKELGLDLPAFGGDAFESREEIFRSKGAMNGAIYSNNIVTDEFRSHYREVYNNDDQIPYAANTYEFAMMVSECIKKLPANPSAEQVLAAITSFPGRDGVSGRYVPQKTVYGDMYFDFPVVIKMIQGKKIETVFQ